MNGEPVGEGPSIPPDEKAAGAVQPDQGSDQNARDLIGKSVDVGEALLGKGAIADPRNTEPQGDSQSEPQPDQPKTEGDFQRAADSLDFKQRALSNTFPIEVGTSTKSDRPHVDILRGVAPEATSGEGGQDDAVQDSTAENPKRAETSPTDELDAQLEHLFSFKKADGTPMNLEERKELIEAVLEISTVRWVRERVARHQRGWDTKPTDKEVKMGRTRERGLKEFSRLLAEEKGQKLIEEAIEDKPINSPAVSPGVRDALLSAPDLAEEVAQKELPSTELPEATS